jgi:cytidylate kinase
LPIVIAIDGPSGSGKSSTSRGVARRLGLRYLDTGAQYRAMTWWMLENGVDPADPAKVAEACSRPRITSGLDPLAPTITVDGRDVSVEVRSAAVTSAVSKVAGVIPVRELIRGLQRSCIRAALDEGEGIVVEGRDISAVVWPQAEVKVYLTADPAARAARRGAELGVGDAARVAADLARRDSEDAKTTRPLEAAEGASVVDGTHLSLDEVIDAVVALAAGRG